MSKATYNQVVYAGHNQAINGMDYMRSGRYRGDGVKHCWNLYPYGKLRTREGQTLDMTLPNTVTWGRGTGEHTILGADTSVVVLPQGVNASPNYPAKYSEIELEDSLRLWLDAEDNDTIELAAGTTKIDRWNDKSDVGYVFNGSGDIMPSVHSDTLSNMGQSVYFDGVSSIFARSNTQGSEENFAESAPYTIFIAGEVGELDRWQVLFDKTTRVRISSTNKFNVRRTSHFYPEKSIESIGTRFGIIAEVNGANSTIDVLGEKATGDTGTTTAFESYGAIIGAENGGLYPFKGYIKEIRIWDKAFSETDYFNLRIYMDRKYSL